MSAPSDLTSQPDGRGTAARVPQALADAFGEATQAGGMVVRAPGRVNLIGEHTDYNDGLAMPAAINLATWVALQPRDDSTLSIRSVTLNQQASVDLAAPLAVAHDWSDYVVGVAWALKKAGVPLSGASLTLFSELPLGAGLASSAALEVGVALALLNAAGVVLEPIAVARLCQQAENEFVGARCGLLDQIAVTHGRRGYALLLDCRSFALAPVSLPDSVRIVLCNSMVTHTHTTGGFNLRRQECEMAVGLLRQRFPQLRSLRDLSWSDFEALGGYLPVPLEQRVRHVLCESLRVTEMARALAGHDNVAIGRCMAESHASLRDLYQVSTPDLDWLVELAWRQRGVIGARMMGGGFGGCTINLVEAGDVERFGANVRDEYARTTGRVPDVFVCEPSDAAVLVRGPW